MYCISSNTVKPIYLKSKNKTLQNFCYIPTGVLYIPSDSIYYDGKQKRYYTKEIPVDSFYISSTEISNLQYREFLADLIKNNEIEKYRIAIVDTQKWNDTKENWKPFIQYYFQHPAYNQYPCVNMSYEGAKLYCEWFAKKINQEQNEYIIEAKLPTATQWEYATRGGKKLAQYSWGGPYTENKHGQKLANFLSIGNGGIHYDDSLKQLIILNHSNGLYCNFSLAGNYNQEKHFDVTAPVKSFYVNQYGLYNTCGNVAEMIETKGIARGGSWHSPGFDVQVTSEMKYSDPNPYVGFRPILIVRRK